MVKMKSEMDSNLVKILPCVIPVYLPFAFTFLCFYTYFSRINFRAKGMDACWSPFPESLQNWPPPLGLQSYFTSWRGLLNRPTLPSSLRTSLSDCSFSCSPPYHLTISVIVCFLSRNLTFHEDRDPFCSILSYNCSG